MSERRQRSKLTDEENFRGDRVNTETGEIIEETDIDIKNIPNEIISDHIPDEEEQTAQESGEKIYRNKQKDNTPHTESDTVNQTSSHWRTPPRGQTIATERIESMSMLDPEVWNLGDSQEPYALSDGSEVRVRILEVRKDNDKNNFEYLLPRFEILDEPYSKDFTHFLHIPTSKMDTKQLNRVRYNMRQFCDCFEIDLSRPSDPTEDWVAHEGWVILGYKKDDQYGEQNFIKKMIAGR